LGRRRKVADSAPPWAKPGDLSAKLYLTANCGLWLAGGLWHKLNWQTSTERVFEYLGKRINDLAARHLSLLITTMCAAGVSTGHHLVARAAALLEQSQVVDGYWKSEDGSSLNVHTTLKALRALHLCGRVVK